MRHIPCVVLVLVLSVASFAVPASAAVSHAGKAISSYLMCVRKQAVKLAVTHDTPSDIAVAAQWACRADHKRATRGLADVPGIEPSIHSVDREASTAARAQVVWARLCNATTQCDHMPPKG